MHNSVGKKFPEKSTRVFGCCFDHIYIAIYFKIDLEDPSLTTLLYIYIYIYSDQRYM